MHLFHDALVSFAERWDIRMKKIAYVIPYFGRFPQQFNLWLISCYKNPTIDWIIFTDDERKFSYPKNVKVYYCTFEQIVERIQKNFDFEIVLNRPWKLCEYRPAYGEIFSAELKGYDFWGHCDIDLIWGDIRKFITDDILKRYDKIGFQGHSTLYRNTPQVNKRYRANISGLISYKEAFTQEEGLCFDEGGIEKIYQALNIPYYAETNFAHLDKYDFNFHLGHLPKEEEYKNKYQIFTWNEGKLLRHYVHKDCVFQEEFMYLHFFCRPMRYKIKDYNLNKKYVIYSDVVVDSQIKITKDFIKKKGTAKPIKYFLKSIIMNRKKITLQKIYGNVSRMIIYRKRKAKM